MPFCGVLNESKNVPQTDMYVIHNVRSNAELLAGLVPCL